MKTISISVGNSGTSLICLLTRVSVCRFSTRFPISLDQLARENSLHHCKIKVGVDPYVNTDVPEYLAIGIRLSRMWRIMQIEGDVIQTRWITSSKICTALHIIRQPNSIFVLLFIQIISACIWKLYSTELWPFSRQGVRKKEQLFYLANNPEHEITSAPYNSLKNYLHWGRSSVLITKVTIMYYY